MERRNPQCWRWQGHRTSAEESCKPILELEKLQKLEKQAVNLERYGYPSPPELR